MPITVSLAEPAARWIDERVATGDYPDAAAYVAELVERDHEDAAKLAALHAALDEGEASGDTGMTIDEIFAEARARDAPIRAGRAEAAELIAADDALTNR